MTKKQKLQVSLFRAFLGFFGVDAFMMKKLPQAITRLAWGVVLLVAMALLVVFSIVKGGTALILCTLAFGVFFVVRFVLYLVGGLLMLKKTEEEVEEMYK